jgi:uncharacterized SAM-binding protein YcdF (DUF218 family)
MRSSISRKWLVLFVVILLPVILYAFRTSALTEVGNFLVISDRIEPANIIFLLNGDTTTRPYHAAELLHQGLAPKVVIARMEDSESVKLGAYPNPTDSNIAVLRKLGLMDSQIVELRPPVGVQHTVDEAEALLAYSREHPLRKVIIVTSDLHSRRARYTFRRVLSGTGVKLMLSPVRDLKYGADNWWRLEDGIIGCQNEYLKLAYYYVKY